MVDRIYVVKSRLDRYAHTPVLAILADHTEAKELLAAIHAAGEGYLKPFSWIEGHDLPFVSNAIRWAFL